MTRQFPLSAALNLIADLEPYYDEGLGCDIHSRQERRRVMAALGVVEAGDARGGARAYDPRLPSESRMEKQPPRGVRFVDPRQPEETIITVRESDGKEYDRSLNDLPSPRSVDRDQARKAFETIQD